MKKNKRRGRKKKKKKKKRNLNIYLIMIHAFGLFSPAAILHIMDHFNILNFLGKLSLLSKFHFLNMKCDF